MEATQLVTGYVYLIGPLEGCHKIGRSKSPEARLGQIESGLPVRLPLAHAIPTGRAVWLEGYLHAAFRHRRARGEWFRLTDEECGLIQSIAAADEESDLPAAVVALRAQNTRTSAVAIRLLWRRKALVFPLCRKPSPDSKRSLGVDRHKDPRKAFHAPAELFAALQAYIDQTRPSPTEAAALRTALEEFLEKRGFWPPKEK